MDIPTRTALVQTAADLMQNESVLNKATGLFSKLFPYFGIEQKAVDVYIEDIKKSEISPVEKAYKILNVQKTFKEIKNQSAIAKVAIDNSRQGTDFSENSRVREEWLDRFVDSARFVSSEEMQLVWGKILANEFEKPGSTPPNMIRILSEITPQLASAFRSICSMFIWIFPLNENGDIQTGFQSISVPFNGNEEVFMEHGVTFNVLNELEALGVIRFNSITGYVLTQQINEQVIICVGDKVSLIEKHPNGEIPIGDVMLTSAGEALKSITDSIVISDYHDVIKKYMLAKAVKFADEHDYFTVVNGNDLTIHKKTAPSNILWKLPFFGEQQQ